MSKRLQIIIFIVICLSGIVYAIFQRKQLEKNYLVSEGEIKNVEYTSKSTDYFVSYTFPEKEGTSKSSLPYVRFKDIVFLRTLLEGKKLFVVYQKDNRENNKMLFLGSDYKKYSITPSKEQQKIIQSIDSLFENK